MNTKIIEVLPAGGFSRLKTFMPLMPFSTATLWRKVKTGEFPAPVKIWDKITCWKNDDINAWLAKHS
jgi:predicted DNA-binding transcriptional regulator AlpA